MTKIISLSFLLCCCSIVYSQQKKAIDLVHANSEEFDKRLGNGAQRLIGNVQLADDSTTLFCDSAYFYSDNSVHAFGHVHMTRKDTMDLYGDSIHYDGETRKAEMFGKIRCIRKGMTLTTRHLMFDIHKHFINYWDGGIIVDSDNTLTSVIGIYNTKQRMCFFKEKVVLLNPKYTVTCDTMDYAPGTRTAFFLGPTRITSKSNFMYCEKGYYNTESNYCQFSQHPYMINKKGDKLSGEQIYYDRQNDFGQVLDNVSLEDTADNIIIKGNYAQYNGDDKTLLVTCKALLLQKYDKDTLHLHGDTLFGKNISVSDTDKSGKPKLLLAYHHVKFFKKDLQGKCDSLTYDEKDSVMRMFYSPILWSDVNQLTADTMRLYMRNKRLDKLDMLNRSFIVSRDTLASKLLAKDDTSTINKDSVKSDSVVIHKIQHGSDTMQFNQIKGRNMKGFFRDNKIYKVVVKGNAQTIYYVYSDNNTSILGVNRADCSSMVLFILENKIKSITFLQKPDATLFPMKDVKPADFLLGGFHWLESQKPRSVAEIMNNEP